MKAILIVLASALALPTFAAKKTELPGYVIPGSEVRTLPVNAAGRQYALFVGLPASYASSPDKRYPVVYVTDGYWDFQKMTAIAGTLVYDKVAPEFITVGMGYAGENLNYGELRQWELSPVVFGERTGHAADYLKTIESVFIPLIDKDYRTDPKHRVLAGASLGGLFTLYSMYTKPDLFQGYIASTPAVVLGGKLLENLEDEFAKSGKPIDARLYMTVGGNETPWYLDGPMRENQRLAIHKFPKLVYEFRVIEGERHAGGQMEAYTRGLRFVFAPLAAETGVSLEPMPGG
jgi:uncharacterized protein